MLCLGCGGDSGGRGGSSGGGYGGGLVLKLASGNKVRWQCFRLVFRHIF